MKDKRAPINTRSEHDPLLFLATAMAMGGSGAIEHQEAQGQRSFVNSDTLPTDMREGCKEALEKLGAKFLGPVEGDPLFQYVELPKGWSKNPTDHSMWSKLMDEKGRERGSIFYKAAFYDRKAHMHLNLRYVIEQDYDRKDAVVYRIQRGDEVVHVLEAIPYGERRWEASDIARKTTEAWLAEHYPDWQDPTAYWD